MAFEKGVLVLKKMRLLTRDGIAAYMIFKVLDMKGDGSMHAENGIGRFTCRKLWKSEGFTAPDIGIVVHRQKRSCSLPQL